jgi:hypothetical protein
MRFRLAELDRAQLDRLRHRLGWFSRKQLPSTVGPARRTRPPRRWIRSLEAIRP